VRNGVELSLPSNFRFFGPRHDIMSWAKTFGILFRHDGMRHIISLIVCGFLFGCTPTWFQDFKDNPIHQTDTVLNHVSSIEQVAIVVFGQLKPLIPADKQDFFQAKFDSAVVVLHASMDTVRAAVRAAAEAQNKSPDFTTVISNVMTAVDAVRGIITEVRDLAKASAPLAASGVSGDEAIGYIELDEMINSLKK